MPGFTHSILMMIVTDVAATPTEAGFQLDPTMLLGGGVALLGVFLLLFGRTVLRTGLGALGALLGILAGNAIAGSLDLGLSPLACSVIGGLLGLAVGILLCRLTVATVMAFSCGALASLILLAAIHGGLVVPVEPTSPSDGHSEVARANQPESMPVSIPSKAEGAPEAQWLDLAGGQATEALRDRARSVESGLMALCNRWLSALNDQLSGIGSRFMGLWGTLTSPAQQALLGVAALGSLFGFMVGLVAWKWSSAVVSALVGGALVLLGGLFTAQIIAPGLGETLWTIHPAFWLVGWTALAGTGGLISWLSDRHRTDRSDVVAA